MSNQIQPFDFNGIQVRVLTDEHGNPWFLGADVCAILGTATNHIREYLDADEITNIRSTDIAQNGGKAPVFVSESGLYSLVLRSRKPEAREFKRWVTHEVLPSIRRHGAYMTESTLEKAVTEPDFLIRLATQIKQERAEKEKAQAQVERMRPKALFADAVETSKTSILVGRLGESPERQWRGYWRHSLVRVAEGQRMADENRQLSQHAHAEIYGIGLVRDQGNHRGSLGRSHDHQQDTESHGQRSDVLRQQVPRTQGDYSMSINLGTTEVVLGLYSKALQLATFTVEVPVVGELEPDSVLIGEDMQPRAHVTVTPPPNGSVEKAVGAGIEAFQKAFNESMESRNV